VGVERVFVFDETQDAALAHAMGHLSAFALGGQGASPTPFRFLQRLPFGVGQFTFGWRSQDSFERFDMNYGEGSGSCCFSSCISRGGWGLTPSFFV
jgi:hypothetical protein